MTDHYSPSEISATSARKNEQGVSEREEAIDILIRRCQRYDLVLVEAYLLPRWVCTLLVVLLHTSKASSALCFTDPPSILLE